MTLPLILVVLMIGCKKDDSKATVGVCPIVVSTIPVNGAVGVPLNQVISATFNEKMNAATITSSSFTVIDATKSPAVVITGSIAYSGMTAFLTPSSPLLPNTTYTGRVTTAARDLMGNALQTDYVWTFSTDSRPIVTSNPPDKAVDVPLGKIIVLTFNVPMDTLSLKSPASTITITQGTIPVPGRFTYTLTTATFTPASNLAPFTVYNGTVSNTVKNSLGTPMAADYIFSFTTIPQLSLSSNPVLGGTTSGAGTFAQGSTVTAIATANTGYSFLNWTDGTTIVSTSASYQFTMAGNKSLVANFTPRFVVNVISNPLIGGTTTGGGTFVSGTSVTVNAVPNIGFTFTNWTEGLNIVSSSAAYAFTIAGNRNLTANYTPIPYTVSVSSNPLAGGLTSGGGIFNSGASVMVTAIPNVGFTFTNWTEGINIVSTSANYLFTLAGNRTLVANYANVPYTVTLISNPLLGGSNAGAGTYNSSALVTVIARANIGYTFKNWTEGVNIVSTNAIYPFTILGNRLLTANYDAIPLTVSVTSNPLLGGTTTGGGTFNFGSSVTVKAVPNVGYNFTNWTEGVDIVSTSADYLFTIASNRNLVANYTAIPYTVSLSSNPLLGGITTGGGIFNAGTLVTATATANPGFTFSNWTEGANIVSTNANYQFTLVGNRTLVANFNAVPYTVSVSSKPLTGGVTTGGGIFNSGSLVTVNATPNVGYTFNNWTEGLVVVSTDANYQFTILGNKILVANYSPTAFKVDVSSSPLAGGITTGGGTFNSGSTVTVTAKANPGYILDIWKEGSVNLSNSTSYTFILTKDRTLVASYIPVTTYNVGVSSNPFAGGITSGGGTYNAGASVNLTALPNAGYTFKNWTEGINIVSTIANYNFSINGNRTFVANFDAVIPPVVLCPTVIDLGLAGNYVILAESGISTTGVTSVTGDMGISPAAATLITGFGLILPAGGAYSTSSLVTGKVYAPGYAAPTPGLLTTAITNMTTAYTTANGVAPTVTELLAGNLNGQTLVKGVYKWSSGVSITNSLTLDGGGDDCATWIFQIAGDLTVANGTNIILQNGAHAKNIFWVVAGSKAALGTTVNFSGNILCATLISLNTGASVNGRLLSQTAVTLVANTAVAP